ncbi:BRE1 E3 ubiquitin ligase-domain-containing protein [Calycina marina]|uniref:E3 ubiquitin protein ligase n=1 Tax=Calycina marina TaxID=1763456 RepID=A0A9P8CJS5_9HELO|nr:BRE1 E3 ubiquitin ligase-domain-containing protein [Calycina marina]
MQEYKREKTTLESQLKDVQKKALDHDDHLRVIDAWWSQLLDEVRLLSEDQLPDTGADISFSTSIQFKGSEDFSTHLAAKSKEIKSKLSNLFTNLSSSRGEQPSSVPDLQGKLTKLLASQKEYLVKFDRLKVQKDEISERLEAASLRYIKAEKRLDRAKSSAVAKLEQQAIAGTGNSGGSGIGGVEDVQMANEIKEERASSSSAYKEAKAVVEKQKEQLDAVTEENKTLTEQLTAASTRLSSLNEDDYAKTELFKQFRIQHEDVIRRINHLEATNIQLRQDAEKFQAERTTYRLQVESENEILTGELEGQLQRVEADLSRIRSARDELSAELSMRKASTDQDHTAHQHIQELVGAKDDRIAAAEMELERLKTQIEQLSPEPLQRPEIDALNLSDLRNAYEALKREFESINKELPALQSAYKRVQALATKKVMDFTVLEERVQILAAEKSKADQKYFAARKDMDTRIAEVRNLRVQNAKSSEIITQLKDVETSNQTLLGNLEKQLGEMKQSNTSIMADNKKFEATTRDATSKCDTLKTQVAELTSLLKSKDTNNAAAKQRINVTELENEKLKVRLEQSQKERDTWKQKSLSNQSGEEEMLRTLALCTICRKDFKNTILKTCGHLFCNHCVDDRIANRMRKCPNCSKSFDKMDVMTAHM